MHKYHHTARMIVWSCCLSLGSVMFALVHYAQYASDGRGAYSMLVGSRVLFVLSDVLMVLLLISLAKGWTIVRSKVSIMGRVKIAIYICTYFAVSISCIIAYDTLYDASQVHFYYTTPPGICLAALRGLACVWFYFAVTLTRRTFKMKARRNAPRSPCSGIAPS